MAEPDSGDYRPALDRARHHADHTQVCLAYESDARTREVTDRLIADAAAVEVAIDALRRASAGG
ncbi:MAG TPA: hypothetical protein VFN19_10330 [Candidatus Nanopelagicales bacterium]|jgi:hypothetical protein|nr:hypothetical protein [Candidatus Nanopelagicales bacterium]